MEHDPEWLKIKFPPTGNILTSLINLPRMIMKSKHLEKSFIKLKTIE
jgi:hypothetical protein